MNAGGILEKKTDSVKKNWINIAAQNDAGIEQKIINGQT